jgi:deazaflavin-dependent oxidoreductase (nitroreductase family)
MTAPTGPDRARFRELNRMMVERLRGAGPMPSASGRPYELRVVRTTGRRSGQERPVPLAVVHHDAGRYLVAPDARRDWVANLDAHPRCAVETADGADEVAARRICGPAAARVVSAYGKAATGPARAAFPFGDDADLDEVEAVLDRMAVFELVGVDAGAGSAS